MTAATESMYGSDATGLVWAYAFAPGQAGVPIRGADVVQHVAATDAGDSFLWLHFDLSNSASEPWLRQHLALPDGFYESLRENASTRVEVVDNRLVAVVHDVQFFGREAESNARVTLCIDARMMVSARTTQLRSIDRLRGAVRLGTTFESAVELLGHLLRDQADVLMVLVREATAEVDDIEDRHLHFGSPGSRSKLGLIRRRLVRLQRVLAPEPAALFRLLGRPPALLREADVDDLRRSAEELSAAVADSAAVVERVRILQDELSAQLDEATNRTLFILTLITASIAPLELISGLFGMNVGGLPLSDSRHGFLIVCVLIAAVIACGALLARALFRRS